MCERDRSTSLSAAVAVKNVSVSRRKFLSAEPSIKLNNVKSREIKRKNAAKRTWDKCETMDGQTNDATNSIEKKKTITGDRSIYDDSKMCRIDFTCTISISFSIACHDSNTRIASIWNEPVMYRRCGRFVLFLFFSSFFFFVSSSLSVGLCIGAFSKRGMPLKKDRTPPVSFNHDSNGPIESELHMRDALKQIHTSLWCDTLKCIIETLRFNNVASSQWLVRVWLDAIFGLENSMINWRRASKSTDEYIRLLCVWRGSCTIGAVIIALIGKL